MKRFRKSLLFVAASLIVICGLLLVACSNKTGDTCEDGHTYGSPQWVWTKTSDGYTASATFVCSVNGEHRETVNADVATDGTTPSTCTVAGRTDYTATVNFEGTTYTDTKQETLPLADHDYDSSSWENDATGHWHLCSVCNGKVDFVAHTPGAEATETSAQTCTVCGYEIAPIVGHTHTPLAAVRENEHEATCKVAGSYDMVVYCSGCGKQLSKKTYSISKIDHDFQEVTTPATCAARGNITRTCSVCQTVEIEEISPLGHAWSSATVDCTHGRECTREHCDASEPALGHNYVEVDSVIKTCTVDGSITHRCTRCEDSYIEITEKADGHKVADGSVWVFQAEDDERVGDSCTYVRTLHANCDVCGTEVTEESVIEKHNYTSSVSRLATCSAKGERTFTCSGCGNHYSQEIAIVESAHSWNEGTEEGNIVTYTCNHNSAHTRTAVLVTEDTTTLDSATASALKEQGEVVLPNASIKFSNEVKELLGEGVQIGANTFYESTLPDGINKDALKGGETIYNLTLSQNDQAVDFNGGSVKVRVPYMLGDSEDPENIAICYISGNAPVYIKAVYVDGYAEFETEHFSYYTVTRLTPAERCAIYGHSNADTVKAPTCVAEGYTLTVCQRCGYTERGSVVPALGHDMGEQITAATCTHNGVIVYTCKRENCTHTYNKVIPALGHEWVLSNNKEATCTEAGFNEYTCAHDSEHKYKITVAQKQHSYSATVTQPTCTTEGYTTYTCVACGTSYQALRRPASGHKYVATVIAPTCTEEGYTLHQCANCDDFYKSDILPAAHVWNIEAATCAEDKFCIVCHTIGEEKTGNHTMVNGVCSVCGQGCEHKFVDEVIEPTCTQKGYVKHTCSICGIERRDYTVDALGHTGKLECSVCGERFISDSFFTEMLLGVLNSDFNIVVNNLEVNASMEEKNINCVIDFAELFIGFDANNEITLSGNGGLTMTGGDYPIPMTTSFVAVVRDGTLYAKVDNFGNSWSQGNGKIVFSNEDRVVYLEMPLDKLSETMGTSNGQFGMMLSQLSEIAKLVKSRIIPLIESIVNSNSEVINSSVFKLAEKFISFEKTANGYVLTIDGEGIFAFIDSLAEKTISECYDEVFGEGAFAKLVTDITAFADRTVGELLQKFEDYGFDIDSFIDDLDAFAASVTGIDDATISMLLGLETDLREIIDNEIINSFKVVDLLNMLIKMKGQGSGDNNDKPVEPDMPGKEPEKPVTHDESQASEMPELTPETLGEQLTAMGGQNLFAMLAGIKGGNAEELKAMIQSTLALITNGANLSVVTDKSGKIQSVTADIVLDLAQMAAVSGTITVTGEYSSEYDYDELVRDVRKTIGRISLTKDNIAWAGEDAEITYFQDGRVKSAANSIIGDQRELCTPEEMMEFLESQKDMEHIMWQINNALQEAEKIAAGRDYTISLIVMENTTFEMVFIDNPMYTYETDCGDWAVINILCERSNVVKQLSVQLVFAFGDGDTHVVPLEGSKTNYTTGKTAMFYFNKISGKIELIEEHQGNKDTKHEYVEEESKHKPAEGCKDYGQRYYTCVHCGKSYIEYYTNGHSEEYRYEYVYDDESQHDCTHGVVINKYCSVCGELFDSYHVSGHATIIESTIDFASKGLEVCEKHHLQVLSCACGKESHIHFEWLEDVFDKPEFEEGKEPVHYLYCRECHLKIEEHVERTKLGCDVTEEITYVISVDEVEVDSLSLSNTYKQHNLVAFLRLADGAETCSEGYYSRYVCLDCGYEEEEHLGYAHDDKWHEKGLITEENLIDLRKYGAKGGYLLIVACACNPKDWNLEVRGKYEYYEHYINDVRTMMYTFLDDGFAIKVEEIRGDKNPVTCEIIIEYKIYLQNEFIRREFKTTKEHRFESSAELTDGAKSCEEGIIITRRCADCGEFSEEYAFYHFMFDKKFDLAEYGAACGEKLIMYTCACGENSNHPHITCENGKDDFYRISESSYYHNEYDRMDVYRCTVTDPVQCNLIYAHKVDNDGVTAYYRILLGCDRNGNNDQRVITYATSVYHEWQDIRDDLGMCRIRVTRMCVLCGEVMYSNEEIEHERLEDHYHYDYPCTQFGTRTLSCSVCGYHESHPIVPVGHTWCYDEEKNIYYCSVCGLENMNGADGDVSLEEISEPEAEFVIVGYHLRGYDKENQDYSGQYIVNVTLILENMDAVLVEINGLVSRYYELDGAFVCFNRSQVVEWAAENLSEEDNANYRIRLSFVPMGGGSDLDYGITFGSLEEANARKLVVAKDNARNEIWGAYYLIMGYDYEINVEIPYEAISNAESIAEVNSIVAEFKAALFNSLEGNYQNIISRFEMEWADLNAPEVFESEYQSIIGMLNGEISSFDELESVVQWFQRLRDRVQSIVNEGK